MKRKDSQLTVARILLRTALREIERLYSGQPKANFDDNGTVQMIREFLSDTK